MNFNAIVPKIKAIAKFNAKAGGKKSSGSNVCVAASPETVIENRNIVNPVSATRETHGVAVQMPATAFEVAVQDSRSMAVVRSTSSHADLGKHDEVFPGVARDTECSSTSVHIAISNASPAHSTTATLATTQMKELSTISTAVEVQVKVAVEDARIVPVVVLERPGQLPSPDSCQFQREEPVAEVVDIKPNDYGETIQATRVAITVTLPAEVACVQPRPAVSTDTTPAIIVKPTEAAAPDGLSKLQIVAVISGMMWACWRMTFWPDPVTKRRTSTWKQAAFGAGAIMLPILLVLVVFIGLPLALYAEIKDKVESIGNDSGRKLQTELNNDISLKQTPLAIKLLGHMFPATFSAVSAR